MCCIPGIRLNTCLMFHENIKNTSCVSKASYEPKMLPTIIVSFLNTAKSLPISTVMDGKEILEKLRSWSNPQKNSASNSDSFCIEF